MSRGRQLRGEGLRFLLAGAANTAASLVAYWALLLVLPYGAAYTLGYLVGVLTAFCLNTWFVFRVPWSWKRLAAFPLVQVANYALGLLLLWLLVEGAGVPDAYAPLISIPATIPFNFAMSRWLMRHRRGGPVVPAAPAAAAPPEVPAPAAGGVALGRLAERDLPLEDRLHGHGPLLRELVAELTDDEARALLDELEPWQRDELPAGELDRRATLLGYGLARGRFGLAERTGLVPQLPPPEVHAMTHAEAAAGGDPWYADLVDTALREAGLDLTAGGDVLDFGCSSGRVVRMLAARRPQARWHGCDVNAAAIAWACEQLPGVAFAEQPLRPPLAFGDGALDAAYAISIWSHYDEAPARAWLDELHRVLRPGGLLLLTTHGPGAVAYRAANPEFGEAAQRPILADLYRRGFSFVGIFGDDGDWGVVDHGWGVSFMTPEWLMAQVTPRWSVALYRPAAVDAHQDLWVLRREPAH